MKNSKVFRLIALLLGVVLITTACAGEPAAQASQEEEQKITNQIATAFADNQPVPVVEWSQQRQNLIEILLAQAQTTATTTFFFNMGVAEPMSQCSSIGFPIPATYQLTNPEQGIKVETVSGGGDPAVDVAQLEITGVYTGETTGTYTICTDSNGRPYADYWEGFVKTVTGAAEWRDGQIVLIGEPTFDFTVGRNNQSSTSSGN